MTRSRALDEEGRRDAFHFSVLLKISLCNKLFLLPSRAKNLNNRRVQVNYRYYYCDTNIS